MKKFPKGFDQDFFAELNILWNNHFKTYATFFSLLSPEDVTFFGLKFILGLRKAILQKNLDVFVFSYCRRRRKRRYFFASKDLQALVYNVIQHNYKGKKTE